MTFEIVTVFLSNSWLASWWIQRWRLCELPSFM